MREILDEWKLFEKKIKLHHSFKRDELWQLTFARLPSCQKSNAMVEMPHTDSAQLLLSSLPFGDDFTVDLFVDLQVTVNYSYNACGIS